MCLFLFGWRELTITNDLSVHMHTADKLTEAGIPFRESVQNTCHRSRHRGTISGLGQNPQYAQLYPVFVKKRDLEEAQFLCTGRKQ